MHGLLLPNPQGLLVDLYSKIFFVWLGIGLCLVGAWYAWRQYRTTRHAAQRQEQGEKSYGDLEYRLLLTRIQQSDHHEVIALFVAYLENFTTREQIYSRTTLWQDTGFSSEEVQHIQDVYYNQQPLHPAIKVKILHYVTTHPIQK